MKTLLISSLLIFLLVFSAMAGEKVLELTWHQTLPVPNDLAGWQLQYSQDQLSWTVFDETIPYQGQITEFAANLTFPSPDNERILWYFRLASFDESGNVSDPSNVEMVPIDFDSPDSPTVFKAIVRIVTQP